MSHKKWFAVALLAAATTISNMAFADNRGVHTAVGAVVGALIGNSVGGQDGAVVGGVLGAVVGATASSGRNDRAYDNRYDARHASRHDYGYRVQDNYHRGPSQGHGQVYYGNGRTYQHDRADRGRYYRDSRRAEYVRHGYGYR